MEDDDVMKTDKLTFKICRKKGRNAPYFTHIF